MKPTRLCTLIFIQDDAGRLLLLERAKSPNAGLWSPPGGKIDMEIGESPFECARRETLEEVGLVIEDQDLHLFSIVTEKAYEGAGHWMMFLFKCKRTLNTTPPSISEGRFAFFSRLEIEALAIPETDKIALWPLFDSHQSRFASLRISCHLETPLKIELEEIH